jgi:hypothetical protein
MIRAPGTPSRPTSGVYMAVLSTGGGRRTRSGDTGRPSRADGHGDHHRLIGLPDRHQVPPAVSRGDREVLRRAAAPVGDLEGLRGRPAVRTKVARAEPHRGDLAATGPAGPRWAEAAGGVEPDGRRHWMISSARASTAGGIVRPSALAVFRLMMSSNLVGCSTGRSAGFAPFRTLST